MKAITTGNPPPNSQKAKQQTREKVNLLKRKVFHLRWLFRVEMERRVVESQPPPGKPKASVEGKSSTPSGPPPPKATPARPGKLPKQCAYFASEGGCQKGDKCMYLHEMENVRRKPALTEDVTKLEARAKTNPTLRPSSKAPAKPLLPFQ